MHGANHEGQADEEQGDVDPQRGVGDLDPDQGEDLAEPAIGHVERGERDAGDGGGEREGEVHRGVHGEPEGEFIPLQHPGQQQADRDRDGGGEEGGDEADAEGGERARVGEEADGAARVDGGGPEDKAGHREQYDQSQPEQRVAKRQSKAGDDP